MDLGFPDWDIEIRCGYRPLTDVWHDIDKAESSEDKDSDLTPVITDLFNNLFEDYKKRSIKEMTELYMALMDRCWSWYVKRCDFDPIGEEDEHCYCYSMFWLYRDLYHKCQDYIFEKDNYSKDDRAYFESTVIDDLNADREPSEPITNWLSPMYYSESDLEIRKKYLIDRKETKKERMERIEEYRYSHFSGGVLASLMHIEIDRYFKTMENKYQGFKIRDNIVYRKQSLSKHIYQCFLTMSHVYFTDVNDDILVTSIYDCKSKRIFHHKDNKELKLCYSEKLKDIHFN